MSDTPTDRLIVSHRPFGSGHPYRHDLDQRVPTHPTAGETFEVRVLTAPDVESVTISLTSEQTNTSGGNGRSDVPAVRVNPSELECDFGPQPARRAESGHLAAAAEATWLDSGAACWKADVCVDGPTTYEVAAASGPTTHVSGPHHVDPVQWSPIEPQHGGLVIDGDQSRVVDGTVEWLTGSAGPIKVRFALRIDDGQHVIGLGERFATLDHRGEQYDCVVFEQYKNQGHRTYIPVPMAIVVGGSHWGFHVDTTRRSWFDLASTVADRLLIEAEVDPAQPVLRLRVWNGPPATIAQQFLTRTGIPPVPPAWIFEPWMSANEWNTQARVEAEVGRSLESDVPVGVVVIEAWSDESTFTAFRDARYDLHPDGSPHQLADFEFPADGAWPDPVGMVNWLHDQGLRVLLWQIPLLPVDRGDAGQIAADLTTLEQRAMCVREADGRPYRNRGWWFPNALIPDFTNPETRKWWTDKRRYLLDEVGIDGFKNDGGEHLWGHDLQFFDGTSGAETNNRFPVLFSETYHELIERTGRDAVTFSRSGFTGSGAYPCHWAGDDDSTWEGLRAALNAGLNAGTAGIWYWTWDLAGFSGPIPDAELYVRAAALATFCPIMQYHAEYNHHRTPSNDRTPWNIAERTGDDRALAVYRRFAHLRRRLVPYLAEQAERSSTTWKPLMRPLFFDHPDDITVWRYPTQFQLGDDLLVAPITTQGVETVDVYLPEGHWVDCFSGIAHMGPTSVKRHVPWHEAAVYRKQVSSSTLDAIFENLPDPQIPATVAE